MRFTILGRLAVWQQVHHESCARLRSSSLSSPLRVSRPSPGRSLSPRNEWNMTASPCLTAASRRMAPDCHQTIHATATSPQLIAVTYSAKRPGRLRLNASTEVLMVRLSTQNPSWGEDSMRDRLAEMGMTVTNRTLDNFLRRHGIPSTPQWLEPNDWQRFLKLHWPHLSEIDFATCEESQDNRTGCQLHQSTFTPMLRWIP